MLDIVQFIFANSNRENWASNKNDWLYDSVYNSYVCFNLCYYPSNSWIWSFSIICL